MSKNRHDVHDDWKTDPRFYDKWNAVYHFDFDPCPWQHDLTLWDGLKIEWGKHNFVNPPYSLELKTAFIQKGIEESKKGKFCFFLLPVSTSTKLFHDLILPNISEPPEFVYRRIPFIGYNKKGQRVNFHLIGEPTDIKASGQFDNMIIRFGPIPS